MAREENVIMSQKRLLWFGSLRKNTSQVKMVRIWLISGFFSHLRKVRLSKTWSNFGLSKIIKIYKKYTYPWLTWVSGDIGIMSALHVSPFPSSGLISRSYPLRTIVDINKCRKAWVLNKKWTSRKRLSLAIWFLQVNCSQVKSLGF